MKFYQCGILHVYVWEVGVHNVRSKVYNHEFSQYISLHISMNYYEEKSVILSTFICEQRVSLLLNINKYTVDFHKITHS